MMTDADDNVAINPEHRYDDHGITAEMRSDWYSWLITFLDEEEREDEAGDTYYGVPYNSSDYLDDEHTSREDCGRYLLIEHDGSETFHYTFDTVQELRGKVEEDTFDEYWRPASAHDLQTGEQIDWHVQVTFQGIDT